MKTHINKELSKVIMDLHLYFLKINNLQSKLTQKRYLNVEFHSY